MAENSSGRPIIIAAVLVSFSILGASFFIGSSLERTTAELAAVTEALEELELAGGGAPPSRPPSRPSRPDRDKEYDVEIGEAPIKGPKDALVTIVEWSDFQCPFCNRVSPTLAQIEEEYGDKVRLVFKHMPLSIHPQAPQAHAASEAAHRQGKFWEMHDRIFANQRDLSIATLESHARAIGLDMDQYAKDVADASVKARIDDDMKQAAGLNVTGTPSFFINGRFLSGAQPFENFKRAIDAAIERAS
ncbi:MAG: DsbA family protein [bacterium]|nr:DsbA family protein [bacterium]